MTRTVSIDAPAKINLGLEILGKRPDGYHDVRTVMAMLELADRLTIGEFVAVDDTRSSDVPLEDNLIHRALFRYREAVPGSPGLGWRIDKRIPTPVITTSLYERFSSRGQNAFAAKVNAALRNQFGGHAVKAK